MKEYQPYTDVMYLMTGYLGSDVDEEIYPHFYIFMNENILFHTLEEAERKIAELARDEELKDERACFFVYEVPVGVNCYPAQGQKIRSYTADGELNSESKVSALEDCNGTLELFPGREEAECRFKVGDKVAVFWGDHFSFETIYALPVDSAFVNSNLSLPVTACTVCYVMPDLLRHARSFRHARLERASILPHIHNSVSDPRSGRG